MKTYLNPKFEIEFIQNNGFSRIVGIDEVGRGCWAGPVAVGAFIFDLDTSRTKGINDSKLLSLKQREEAYLSLSQNSHKVKLGGVEMINNIGIGKTIEFLIKDIINELTDTSTFFIIDGQFSINFGANTKKAIKADSTYYSVAAASIIAKVQRDRLMNELHNKYPQYNFKNNKGYATKFHRDVLNQIGVTEIHRRSFIPIRNLLEAVKLRS